MATSSTVPVVRMERWALVATLSAVMFPVATGVGIVGIALYQIPMLLLIFLWFARVSAAPSGGFRIQRWELLFAILAFWMFLCSLASGSSQESLRQLSIWASAIVLALYAARNYGKTFGMPLISSFAAFAIGLQAILCGVQLITGSRIGMASAYFGELSSTAGLHGGDIQSFGAARVVGTVGQPNLVANWAVVLLPFAYGASAGLLRHVGRKGQMAFFLIWIAGSLVPVLAVSRFNMAIALLTPLLIFAVRRVPWRRPPAFQFGIRVRKTVVASLLGIFVWVMVGDRITAGATKTIGAVALRIAKSSDAASYRLTHYMEGLDYALDHPIVGTGFGGSADIWSSFDSSLPSTWKFRIHNIAILFAVEGGILAAVLLLGILGGPLIRYVIRHRDYAYEQDLLAISLTCYLLAASVYLLPVGHGLWPLFMFLYGCFRASLKSRKL